MWEKEKKKREKKKEKREKTKEKRNIKFYEDLLTKTCLNLKKIFKHPPTMVGNVSYRYCAVNTQAQRGTGYQYVFGARHGAQKPLQHLLF